MKKTTKQWTVKQLRDRFVDINFAEYQREPNLWSLGAKQSLIDSMLRQFDIASLYFYQHDDQSLDCIDGRQRINAIMSFLGQNANDKDNNFSLRILNEIYQDEDHPFDSLGGLTFTRIQESGEKRNNVARSAIEMLLSYEITFVLLSEVTRPEEFNLQFTRLNLGTIINAGEKLHAMVGQMRDVCFDDERIGRHSFLEMVNIPTRRYAKEQVAAQVLAQVFSIKEKGEFTRTRYFDLQKFFKRYAELGKSQESGLLKSKTRLTH